MIAFTTTIANYDTEGEEDRLSIIKSRVFLEMDMCQFNYIKIMDIWFLTGIQCNQGLQNILIS